MHRPEGADPAVGGLVPAGAKHPVVSALRRLQGRRSARSEAGEVLVEGARAVADALDDGVAPAALVVGERAAGDAAVVALAARVAATGAPCLVVADHVLDAVASTRSPQPVVAALRWSPRPGAALAGPELGAIHRLLVLAGVADPGNAGALLRVAEAAGAGAVVFADGSVDPANPKVVRAAAGSLFRLTVVVADDSAAVVTGLRAAGRYCVGLTGRGGVRPDEVPADVPLAVVVGSEAHGIAAATAAGLDGLVTIPMAGRVESLNAAVAAAVVCFDLARRSAPA